MAGLFLSMLSLRMFNEINDLSPKVKIAMKHVGKGSVALLLFTVVRRPSSVSK